ASRPTYWANCTGNGRSYPSCRRSSSTWAGVAVSPATSATGSAGITREMTNVTTRRPRSVGTNHARRCSASASSLIDGRRRPEPAQGAPGVGPPLLRVVEPAYVLSVSDRAEGDPFETLRPGP